MNKGVVRFFVLPVLIVFFSLAVSGAVVDLNKKEVFKAQFDGAQELINMQMESFNLIKESVDSYIPCLYGMSNCDNRIYKPYFFKTWGMTVLGKEFEADSKYYMNDIKMYDAFLNKIKEYKCLYLYSKTWSGEYDFMVLKEDRVLYVKPYLKSHKSDELFLSSNSWRKAMGDRLMHLMETDDDGEILSRLEKMESIENPQWNFHIKERKISPLICRKIYNIMGEFKDVHKYPKYNSSFMMESVLYFFERYFIHLGEADYQCYGLDSEMFGMSLLGGDRFSTENSRPKKMSILFKNLRCYCLHEDVNQKKIDSLCEDYLNYYRKN